MNEEEAPRDDEALQRRETKIVRIGTVVEDEPITEIVKIDKKDSFHEESKVAEESINLEQCDTALSVVFPATMCRICGKSPITGVLYRCLTFRDHTFCPACEASQSDVHFKQHALIKIRSPELDPEL